jgi:hypothetical protein
MSESRETTMVDPTEELSVPGRQLIVQNKRVPLASLHLDATNPRLKHEVLMGDAQGRTLTESQIEQILYKFDAVKKLYRSIVASGGLSEALWVSKSGRVYEGNERLVALRKLARDLHGAQHQRLFTESVVGRLEELISHVPVKVLPDDITEAELDILLARLHVSGKDEWPAFNQAAHIHKMHHEDGFDIENMAELLGVSKAWIYMRLRAFEWAKSFMAEYKVNDLSIYSFFEEAYKINAKLRRAGFDLDRDETMRLFHRMILSKELQWAIDVRKLPKMLENDKTRDLILAGKVREARKILPQFDPSEFSPRLAALVRAKEQLAKLDREDMRMIKENAGYQRILTDLSKDIQTVVSQAKGG